MTRQRIARQTAVAGESTRRRLSIPFESWAHPSHLFTLRWRRAWPRAGLLSNGRRHGAKKTRLDIGSLIEEVSYLSMKVGLASTNLRDRRPSISLRGWRNFILA